MRQARERQFDPADPPWLHCISRCVRRAFLCGDGYAHRKAWLERRLRLLSRCFAVEVGGYSILSNHLHAVVRPTPGAVASWTDAEVALAWWCVRYDIDPADPAPDPAVRQRPTAAELDRLTGDAAFIARWRARLGTVSWFMKALKEPLSRMANREDDCTGAFWEGRFTSVPLLDQAAIVAYLAYVDLNPIRAKLADRPEASEHTSVKTRIEQRAARESAEELRRTGQRREAATVLRTAGVAGAATPAASCSNPRRPDAEDQRPGWLTPIARLTSICAGDPGWELDRYLLLVELTGRVMRAGKRGAIPTELPALLDRLDTGDGPAIDPARWLATVARPRGLRGTALGALPRLAAEATRRGLQWLQTRSALYAGCRAQPA